MTLAAVLALGLVDANDSMVDEREGRLRAERLAQDRAVLANQLPAVTFVLQARTPEELRERLADVAGAADGERIRTLIPTK